MFQAEVIWNRIKRKALAQRNVVFLTSCSKAGGFSLSLTSSGFHGPVLPSMCRPCASFLSLSFPLLVPSLEKRKLSTKLTYLPNKAETGIER